jgi:predicted Zn-dependent protease
VDVLDDPAGARPNVRRTADDEGMPVVRRWLLRGGVVEQPLADLMGGGTSDRLVPGAARRAGRHLSPVPRSTHLELLPGSTSPGDLVANCGDGLQVPELSRGSLDPLSGELRLDFPYARRIEGGRLAGLTAGGRLRGSVVETLGSVAAVGDDAVPAGAGWCAKGGQLMPVWATAPSVLMTGVEVSG